MTVLVILGVITLVIFVWKLRGKYEVQKSTEYQENQRKKLENAKRSLAWLREQSKKPLSEPYERYGRDGDYSWRNQFYSFWHEGGNSVLKKLDTTRDEVVFLIKAHDIRLEWCDLADELNTTDYNEKHFEYYLKSRIEFLEKNGKKLQDFGIDHDDTEELRSAFFVRFARRKANEALVQINKAEYCLSEFKSGTSTLRLQDEDFGLTEAKRRISRLLTMK